MRSNGRISSRITMTIGMAAQNMFWLASPAGIYVLTMRWRRKMQATEIARRLGLTFGSLRYYLISLAVTMPIGMASILMSSRTSDFKGSMIAPFAGAPPTLENIIGILAYGILATGFPEELLFRGLIAGACFRRASFWRANFLQAGIFTLPHLLILFVAPRLWPLAICAPMGLGLIMGWLRHSSGSIWPAVIVHAGGNMAGAFAVMNWSK